MIHKPADDGDHTLETSHTIEIYTAYIETITANENRRQQASNVYLAMVVAVATVGGAFQEIERIVLASASFLVSLVWLFSICYFRRLAKAKFAVIDCFESTLGFGAFKLERKALKEFKASRKHLKLMRLELTHLEMIVPLLAVVVSGGYILVKGFTWLSELGGHLRT